MDVEVEMAPEENPRSEPEVAGDLGPIHPSAEVRADAEVLLEADESRLGEVYCTAAVSSQTTPLQKSWVCPLLNLSGTIGES